MDNEKNNVGGLPVRFPGALSLKDFVMLVSVAISLTLAWGVFGTRLTLNEKDVASHSIAITKGQEATDRLTGRVDRLEKQQQGDEFMIDQLYENAERPAPKRRVPYP